MEAYNYENIKITIHWSINHVISEHLGNIPSDLTDSNYPDSYLHLLVHS